MKDERYRQIMTNLGMPNSRSLLQALRQVANEVGQEVHEKYRKNKLTKEWTMPKFTKENLEAETKYMKEH